MNVAGTVRESREGLLIADTIGGLTLAERIFETKGWRNSRSIALRRRLSH